MGTRHSRVPWEHGELALGLVEGLCCTGQSSGPCPGALTQDSARGPMQGRSGVSHRTLGAKAQAPPLICQTGREESLPPAAEGGRVELQDVPPGQGACVIALEQQCWVHQAAPLAHGHSGSWPGLPTVATSANLPSLPPDPAPIPRDVAPCLAWPRPSQGNLQSSPRPHGVQRGTGLWKVQHSPGQPGHAVWGGLDS